MSVAIAALLAVIVLGGPFGEATAEGLPSESGIRVELEVVVDGAPVAVVAHFADPGRAQRTISLGNRSGGVWGGIAGLDALNYVVVFEAVDAGGEGTLSEPSTLLELGLAPADLGMGDVEPGFETDEDRPLSPVTRRWGWAAAALTAVALSLLAVWAMGDRVRGKHRAVRGKRRTRPEEPHLPS